MSAEQTTTKTAPAQIGAPAAAPARGAHRTGLAAATAKVSPMESVRAMLESRKAELARALPRHMTADRLLRVVLTAVTRTPRLAECTTASLYGAVMQAAQLGLEPDGALGQGFLIPRKNTKKGVIEAKFQPGYRGLLALAWNSEQVAGVVAECVYEGDEFRFRMGLTPILEHVPCGETDAGKITHAYAVVTTTSGGKVFKVLNRRQIDAVAASSSNTDPDSPWRTYYAPMAEKTALIRALKLAPVSVEVRGALEPDDDSQTAAPAPTREADFSVVAAPAAPAQEEAPETPPQALPIPEQVIAPTPTPTPAGQAAPSAPIAPDPAAELAAAGEEFAAACASLSGAQIQGIREQCGLADGQVTVGKVREAIRVAQAMLARKAKGGR